MNIKVEQLKERILASQGKEKADFILRNAKIADVFSLEWKLADIVVTNGYIVAVDATGSFTAKAEQDAKGKYVVPGLIDAHIHIESSMVTPLAFSRILLPHGVTTVITDPHEIANVSGADGIQFMIDESLKSEMDIHIMLPSSVPATPFEHAGAVLKAKDLQPFLTKEKVLGLAEVMDSPAVLSGDPDMLDKIAMALEANVPIDGHGAGLNPNQIRGYRVAGIHTDHECVTAEEALNRVAQGMYVLIREGSAAKNLKDVLPAVNSQNARRFMFCTDDKHLDELIDEGSIDHAIRLAIKEGMEPLQAIQLATLNAAECYKLYNKGAIAPGFIADFFMVDSLESFRAISVWKNGLKIAEDNKMLKVNVSEDYLPQHIANTVSLPALSVTDFAIPITNNGVAHIIEIIPNQITTRKKVQKIPVSKGFFTPCTEQDLLKLAVIERHQASGNIGLGIVNGFGIKKGAVATTIAHDSHNMIVLGTNDEDMLAACKHLESIQGGVVIIEAGKVLASLSLPIAGLMSDKPASQTANELKYLHDSLESIHPNLEFHLLLTLSFVSLPVIPELKLTDKGLFDVIAYKHIPIQA